MLIAQLTDTHVRPDGKAAYGIVDSNQMLDDAVDTLLALDRQPDVVVVSGDLTDFGLPEEYAKLRELLSPLPMPVYLVPGNHDLREAFRSSMPELDYLPSDTAFAHYVVETRPVRLIGLDTIREGSHGGELCADRLQWIENRLDENRETPTLIFMHHPPIKAGMMELDGWGFPGAGEFAEIIERHPQVVRIVCGHYHRSFQSMIGNCLCYAAPGTAHGGELSLSETNPHALMRLHPPTIALHLWHHGSMISHLEMVPTGPGPYAVSWDRSRPDEASSRLALNGEITSSSY